MFWAPLVGREGVSQGPWLLLVLLGGFGPSIAGVIFIYLTREKEGRRDFWRRTFALAPIGAFGWAVILLLPLLLYGGSVLVYWLLTQSLPTFAFGREMLSAPGLLISTLIITFIAGPFSEELGWRGYSVDKLLEQFGVIPASLILGVVWWAWHIPLFFIEGRIQADMGFLSLDSLGYFVGTVTFSIYMTWLYLRTGRSIMAAILLHFTVNLVSQIVLAGADLGPVWAVVTIVMNLILTTVIVVMPGGLTSGEQGAAVAVASD